MSVKNRLKKQSRKIWFKETQEKSDMWGVSKIKIRELKNK